MQVVFDKLPDETAVFYAQTIGGFDGVHLGHQYLLRQLQQVARDEGLGTMVITFHEPPACILHPDASPKQLTLLEEKLALIEAVGVDVVAVLNFDNELADMRARDFMEKVLVRQLRGKHLIVGYDHHFGRRCGETFADYCRYGQELGIAVTQTKEFHTANGVHVSSSAIRAALAGGNVEQAANLLGRPYSVGGRVVHGDGIGRDLGFPTANIALTSCGKLLPKEGAYVVRVHLGQQTNGGMLYVGVRPTIGGTGEHRIEVHLIDFEADIYGCEIEVEFLSRLRGEQQFASIQDLRDQLQRDLRETRHRLCQE